MMEASAAERRAANAELRAADMLARLAVLAGAEDGSRTDLGAASDALARVEERVRQLGAELADARDAAWDTAQRGAELEESLDISHQVCAGVCSPVAKAYWWSKNAAHDVPLTSP